MKRAIFIYCIFWLLLPSIFAYTPVKDAVADINAQNLLELAPKITKFVDEFSGTHAEIIPFLQTFETKFNELFATPSNLNTQDNNGNTILHYLVQIKDTLRASKELKIRLMEKLLKQGANPNIQNNEGNTPLHAAIQSKKFPTQKRYIITWYAPSTLTLLLSHGANPTLLNKQGKTAYDIAYQAINDQTAYEVYKKESLKLLKQALLMYHAKQDKDGNTTLMNAIQKGDITTVKMLLKQFAPLTIKNNKDQTPLIIARKTKNKELIKLLENAVNNMLQEQREETTQFFKSK